ncbi:MAG: chalcone isomerase family protein [Desulfobacterales bacterium]|nr:chalcone isomerase family protein [Desulfobacterales bacterium]
MPKKLFFLILTFFMIVSISNAIEIDGINMPDSLMTGKTNLILNGAGVRTKLLIKLYISGLYLMQKNHDPKKIIEADEPMAIRLHIISSLITGKKMGESTKEGFSRATHGNIEPIKPEIEKFILVFKDRINENDIYDLIYEPSRGVEVYKNHKKHSLINGLPFKKALFGIWLCDNPAQKSLKREMLGTVGGVTVKWE